MEPMFRSWLTTPRARQIRRFTQEGEQAAVQRTLDAVEYWRAEDAAQAAAEHAEAVARMHQDTLVTGWGKQWDPLRREQCRAQQPPCYVKGISVNPLTGKTIAIIRLASSYVHLFVDVSDLVAELSKNRRRQWQRHGHVPAAILERCYRVALDYQYPR